ncbi:transposase [Thermodesulfobacterium thermophilum]|uniref:transposase n=1 Tax=Thermodesulfobacterium thermophilum TaxID=886 RepID=UPI0009DC07C2|nr:transposase [Thermodesulfobacterium thermophilum]
MGSAINWREVLVELKGRGLKRVEVVIGDGLRGLKEAVKLEFLGARSQLCVLHAVRGSLRKVRNKDRKG